MTVGADMATVAALVGDPARANMLAALLDGRAHTATELSRIAGVASPTASGHLGKMEQARLVSVVAQGRHRYYSLGSDRVARMLESIMVVAEGSAPAVRRATPRIDPELRRARTCYDHIAGELGVAIADALAARGAVELADGGAAVTETGRLMFTQAGLPMDEPKRGRRPYCRACLDWSERRPHLAGVLGAQLLSHALHLGVVQKREGTRALSFHGDAAKALHDLGLN